jgi:single-strand DNA-binding protein
MINTATLIGRVDKKEHKTLKNGGEITVLFVVTNKNYKDPTGKIQELATWHIVNCFHKVSEIANKYIKIGDLVYVRGEIQNKRTDKAGHESQYTYSITADTVKFIPTDNKRRFKDGKATEDDDNCGNY